MKTLSISEARTYRECPRKHHFSWTRRIRPRVVAEPLFFGKLFHRAQESYWKGNGDLDAAIAAIVDLEADPYLEKTVIALMVGYHERWESQRFEILGVEKKFEVPLVNPQTRRSSRTFVLKGIIDVLVRTADGVFVVEHKTSSDDITPGSAYWRALRMDPQISTYVAGAASLGHEIQGCIYDVVGKPQLRPKRATPEDKRKYKKDGSLYANQRAEDETPDEYLARLVEKIASDPDRFYQRGEVVRLEDEAEEAAADLWLTALGIKESRRLQMYPRNTDACFKWGRPCEFFEACSGTASIDDPLLFEERQPREEQAA